MSHCAVFGCNNNARYTKGKVNFFRFPADLSIRSKWIEACRRIDNFNVDNARICSVHFEEEAFWKSMQQVLLNYSPKSRRKLKINAVPAVNLPMSLGEKEVHRGIREKSEVGVMRRLVNTSFEESDALESGNTDDSSVSSGCVGEDSCRTKSLNYDWEVAENPLYLLLAASEIMESRTAMT